MDIPTPNQEPQLRRSGNRLILLLAGSLGVITILIAAHEYLSMRHLTEELATEQAIGLVRQLENSVELATRSEAGVRITLTDHLIAAARLVRLWISDNAATTSILSMLRDQSGVSRIDLIDPTGNWTGSSNPADTILVPVWLSDTTAEYTPEQWREGYYGSDPSDEYYGAAVNTADDIRVLVGIYADELLSIRRELGPGVLLADLSEQPEVDYAIIDSPDGLIAATPDIPAWLEQPGSPLHDRALKVTDFQAGFIHTPDGEIFEAIAPYGDYDGVVLRLGLKTERLHNIRQKALQEMLLRTALFIILSALLVQFVISRKNMSLLKQERQRILADIRALEEDRAQKERLSAMGVLAGGVAHEIRNPLNTITMAAQRLESEIDPTRSPDLFKQVVQAMSAEARRIERIIREFLEFARPPKAHKQPGNLHDILQPVSDSFQQLATGKGVNFSYEIPEIRVTADSDLLRQAVLNLLQNALDAVPSEQGSIELVIRDQGDWITLDIRDNGPGIPVEMRQRVFDLYFTTRAEGTGLGLPLVHRVATEHNGRVEISDMDHGGASVKMHIRKDS